MLRALRSLIGSSSSAFNVALLFRLPYSARFRSRYIAPDILRILYIDPDIQLCYNDTVKKLGINISAPASIRKTGDIMPATKAQQKAVAKYMKNNYDEVKIRIPKGRKEAIQSVAGKQGESLNGFVSTAIDERIERLNGSRAQRVMCGGIRLPGEYEAEDKQ